MGLETFILKAVIAAVVSLVIGYALTAIFAPTPPDRPNLKSPGSRQRQPPNTDNKLPIFYGTNQNKGTVVAVALSSDRKKMAFIIAVGHGAIDSVDKVFWGDSLLFFDGNYDAGLVTVTNAVDLHNNSESFLNGGRMKFRMYSSGGRCTEMERFSPRDWSATDQMTDTPFMYVELTYSAQKGVTRLGNLKIEFNGRASKSIMQSPADPTTHPSGFSYSLSQFRTYSINPARCFLDYAMDEVDGGKLPIEEMDLESLYELQEFCDRDLYVYAAYADGNTIPSALLSRDPPLPVTTFSRTPTLVRGTSAAARATTIDIRGGTHTTNGNVRTIVGATLVSSVFDFRITRRSNRGLKSTASCNTGNNLYGASMVIQGNTVNIFGGYGECRTVHRGFKNTHVSHNNRRGYPGAIINSSTIITNTSGKITRVVGTLGVTVGGTITNNYIGTIITQDPITDGATLDNPGSYTWRPYSDTISTNPTRKLFTCNGAVDTNSNIGVNMVDMLTCCQATPTFELGKLGVVINTKKDIVYPNNTYQYLPTYGANDDEIQSSKDNLIARLRGIDHRFNEDNIFGGVDISFSTSKSTLNEITLDFNNIRSKFNPDQITIRAPESIKNPNEYISSDTVTLRFTNNNVEARILGTIIMNQSRQDISVKFSTDLRGLTLRSGDIFSLTQEAFGMLEKKFRVTRLDEIEINGAHGIEITGVEYADEIYDVAALNDSNVATNTILLRPTSEAEIYSLNAVEDITIDAPNLTVVFTVTDSQYVGYYEVRYKIATSPDSAYTTVNVPNTVQSTVVLNGVSQDAIVHSITGLTASSNYTVGVRTVSGLGAPIKGQWFSRQFRTDPSRIQGIRGPGVFSRTFSRAAPEVNSEAFRQDALSALVNTLGSGAVATPVNGDVVTITYETTSQVPGRTTRNATLDIDLLEGQWDSAFTANANIYFINNLSDGNAIAYNLSTRGRRTKLDVDLMSIGGTLAASVAIPQDSTTELFLLNSNTSVVESFILTGPTLTPSEHNITLGAGDWRGGTATSETIYFVDNTTNMAQARNISTRNRTRSKDIDLGAGDWSSAVATEETLFFVDNITNYARAYNISDRQREVGKDIDLGIGFWDAAVAVVEGETRILYFINDSAGGGAIIGDTAVGYKYTLNSTTTTRTALKARNDGTGNDLEPITATNTSNWQPIV